MSMMSDLHVDVAYGAPEMNKEYLDNIINGNALDELAQEQETEDKFADLNNQQETEEKFADLANQQ